jgi:aldose 1-epimerase
VLVPDQNKQLAFRFSTRVTPRDRNLPGWERESLWLAFEGHTTKPTLVSLSAHPYFNLAGAEIGDVLDHVVTIPSDTFLPTDDKRIPTGEIRSVAGTPFDFREPMPLEARIRQADPQLIYATGYDQCFVLGTGQAPAPTSPPARSIRRAAG